MNYSSIKKIIFLFAMIALGFLQLSCEKEQITYLDVYQSFCFYDSPPAEGEIPNVFACGIISKGFHELNLLISSDSSRLFYLTSDRNYSHYSLVEMVRQNDTWSYPRLPNETINYSIYSCFLSNDNSKLFFSTNRSLEYNQETLYGKNNWFARIDSNGLGEPILLDEILNGNNSDQISSISESGNIYLTREIKDRQTDIYVSRFIDDELLEPQPLGGLINSEFNEGRPFISTDETYLIFQSNRPGGFGGNDLWISFRDSNNNWGKAINMGANINSEESDFCPNVSPDGRYLFFSSYRDNPKSAKKIKNYSELMEYYHSPYNGYATLFWTNAAIIEILRNESEQE